VNFHQKSKNFWIEKGYLNLGPKLGPKLEFLTFSWIFEKIADA